MKEWTVSQLTPDQNFEFVVEYSGSREYYPLEVTYTYEPTTEHSMDVLNYQAALTHPVGGLVRRLFVLLQYVVCVAIVVVCVAMVVVNVALSVIYISSWIVYVVSYFIMIRCGVYA